MVLPELRGAKTVPIFTIVANERVLRFFRAA